MDIAKPAASSSRWFRPRPRTWWLAGGAVSIIGVAALGLVGLGQAAPGVARTSLWIDRADQGDMVREIRANGLLVPRDIRWITAGAVATLQQVVVEAGARVEADTVILRMANPELLANQEKAEAALAGAEADVAAARTALASQLLDQQAVQAQAESEWKIAQVKAQAYERAHAAGVISAIDLREATITEEQQEGRARIETRRVAAFRENMAAQLRAAQARRDEAASVLAIARQQVAALEVRAGSAGILQQVDVEPGQQVELGAKLARVARPEELIARLQVPEVLAKDLLLDLPVRVDTRNGVAEGRVSRIDPAVRNGSVTVDVALGELPSGARPDLSIEGRIGLGTLRDVVSIPRPSLAVPDSDGELFVLASGDDEARRVPVRYGAASSDRIQILEGLRPGDQAVLSDTTQWAQSPRLRLR
ncbi:HlyD family efflux transporter periplasmic adaptor subunit [Xanthomonas sp. XNM01]|uniref:efflux RND transporter periplasmic adaptor subunit n=1 Tax=Xanthomonas sp. XNM01 TaxID=2769289 RepID=UPI0017831940|nr:HlyD family efflux transporter periplasmic adaptor subunit [Xanthomonas sp. XNM01]MBD9369779.1 HlyD family efflux transporter periplasmic adaptor subunit [Xanthomonas sp. XNM01]